MSDGEGINRISLRIPADLFRKLEDRRHAERTTFQEVGLRLFETWLSQEESDDPMAKSPTSFHLERELLKRLKITAAQRGVTQTDAVARAIEHWLDPRKPLSSKEFTDPKFQNLDSGVAKAHNQAIDRVLERMELVFSAMRGLEEAIGELGGISSGEPVEDEGGSGGQVPSETLSDKVKQVVAKAEGWLPNTAGTAGSAPGSRKGRKAGKKLPPRDAKGA